MAEPGWLPCIYRRKASTWTPSLHTSKALPSYARPIFLRIQHDQETTSTFKLVKKTLREEGYDLAKVGGDSLFVLKPGSSTYEPLTAAYLDTIMAGDAGF